MNEIILLTDNLLKNILQKIRETKEDLQQQIVDSGKQLQSQIDQMRAELKSTQSAVTAGTHPSSPAYSTTSIVSNGDYVSEIRELRGMQKKLTFDFHFLNERISQMQKINDSRAEGLKNQLERLELSLHEQKEALTETDSILKETQDILEAVNEANTRNSKRIDSIVQDVFKPIDHTPRDYNHNLTDRLDHDYKSSTIMDFGLQNSLRGSLNLEAPKKISQPPTQQTSPAVPKDPFARNSPHEERDRAAELGRGSYGPTQHSPGYEPRDSHHSRSKTTEEVSFDVDEEGYLIDTEGNYVYGDDGETIKLSPTEIEAFLSSKA